MMKTYQQPCQQYTRVREGKGSELDSAIMGEN